MRIATWNVNSLTARWPRVEEWIRAHAPDVLLIQETKQRDEKFPFDDLRALGYDAAHYGQGQWNGVALVSRVGLEDVERGLGDDDPEARVIAATCGGVRVLSCYVPNGRALDDPHYEYKLRWLARLTHNVAQRPPEQSIVLGGDFNVTMTDLDVYDVNAFVNATHVSEPERAAMRALLGADLIDLARQHSPSDVQFTWWDYRNMAFRRGWGLRIDYLLADPHTASRVRDVWVDRAARKAERPSDHAPVVVDLN